MVSVRIMPAMSPEFNMSVWNGMKAFAFSTMGTLKSCGPEVWC